VGEPAIETIARLMRQADARTIELVRELLDQEDHRRVAERGRCRRCERPRDEHPDGYCAVCAQTKR
jgi:ribosomal 50S subunit-associated protein YjgA (DUF615 family)